MASGVLSSNEITVLFGLDWLLVVIVFLALMFQFNRLIGWILTIVAKVLLWNQYKVSVHLQSFKISLLAGRIFVKNFTLVTKDFTLCVLEGNLTWRYWFLNVKDSEYNLVRNELADSGGESNLNAKGRVDNEKLPARFLVQIDGLELFVYNRTYAYEYVLDQLKKATNKKGEGVFDADTNLNQPLDTGLKQRVKKMTNKNNVPKTSDEFTSGADSSLDKNNSSTDEKAKIPIPLDSPTSLSSSPSTLAKFLPVEFQINKCGVVIGNENTTSIIVSSFASGAGSFDIGQAANARLDHYRHNIKFEWERFLIQFKPNVSYKEPISSAHLNSNNFNIHEEYIRKRRQRRFRRYKTLWNEFLNILQIKYRKKKSHLEDLLGTENNNKEWKGLPQYLKSDEDENLLTDYNNLKDQLSQEYAIYRTVIDADKCEILYYYDVPGKVPNKVTNSPPSVGPDIGNDGDPPKTGLNILLHESTIYYGPWADRQRISFYKVFFPQANNFEDCSTTPKLKPGDTRVYTYFNFSVKFVDDKSIIRVPMREYSKDLANSILKAKENRANQQSETGIEDKELKRKKPKDSAKENLKRPFAWVELKLFKDSTVDLNTEYEKDVDGSNVDMCLKLKEPELRSSINHNIFYKAKEHCVKVKINFPLAWKQIITWKLFNSSTNSELFLLREHVSLISDLLNDFATMENSLLNNPSEMVNSYNSFRPYEYKVQWKMFDGLKLYLNINNQNIINNPLDFDDNTYICYQTNMLDINLLVPMHEVFLKSHCINYCIESDKIALILDTPAWNTLHTFLKNKELANGTDLRIEGSYTYHSSIELNLVDEIIVKCFLSNTTFQAYGFLVKAIMDIKENYFGENVHFKTLEEYSEKKPSGDESQSELSKSPTISLQSNLASRFNNEPRFKTTNRNKVQEPKRIRRIENEIDVMFSFCVDNGCVILPCNMYDCDNFIAARLSSFDIDIRFTNYYMDLQCDISPLKVKHVKNNPEAVRTAVYDTSINNNPNMFINGIVIHGHRIFGLPPLEPTYVCKWDISAGAITIDSQADFLTLLEGVGEKFGYTFKDLENSLVVLIPDLNDVTLFSFNCPCITVTLSDSMDETCLLFSLEPVSMKAEDLANDRYTMRLDFKAKSIIVKITEKISSNILLYATTSAYVTNFCKKKNFSEHRRLQQEHLKLHDGPFHRLPFFLNEENRDDMYKKSYRKTIPSLSLPDVAPPITNQTVDFVFDKFPFANDFVGDSSIFDETFSAKSGSTVASTTDEALEKENPDSLLEFLPDKNLKGQRSVSKKFVVGEEGYFQNADEETLAPRLDMSDQHYEYDNFVINLSSVDVFLSPQSVVAFSNISEGFVSYSANSILDSLQIEVLLELLIAEQNFFSAISARLVCPEINLRYGELLSTVSIFDLESLINTNKEDPQCAASMQNVFREEVVDITINSPSLAASFKKKSEGDSLFKEQTLALSISSIHVSVMDFSAKKFLQSLVAQAGVDDIEVWLDEGGSLVSSLNLETFDCEIFASRVEWLAEFLSKNVEILQPAITKLTQISQRGRRNIIELMYKLSIASEKYNIHHDPSVLTRPTHIVRNSETKHVRTFDSWRILIRIRHILQNLPSDWEDFFKLSNTKGWQDSRYALSTILKVFSKWRSWEFSNIRQNYIFKKVFKDILTEKMDKKPENIGFSLILKTFIIKLSSFEQAPDIVLLENIEGELFMDNDALKANSNLKTALNLGRIDVSISPLILALAKLINVFEKVAEKYNQEDNDKIETYSESGDTFSTHRDSRRPLDITFSFSAKELKNTIALGKISHVFSVEDVICSTYVVTGELDDNISFSSAAHMGLGSSLVMLDNEVAIDNKILDWSFNFSNANSITKGLSVAELLIGTIDCDMSQGSSTYTRLLEAFYNHDIDVLLEAKAKFALASETNVVSGTAPSSVNSNSFFCSLMGSLKFLFLLDIQTVRWRLEVMSPILIAGSADNIKYSATYLNYGIHSSGSFENFTIDIIYNLYAKRFLARYKQPLYSFTIKGSSNKEPLVLVDMACANTELSIFLLLRSIDALADSKGQMGMHIQEYSRYINLIQEKVSSGGPKQPVNDFYKDSGILDYLKKVLFRVSLEIESTSLTTEVDGTKGVLEFSGISATLGNFEPPALETELYCRSPLYGSVVNASTSFTVIDPLVPQLCAKVVDFNFNAAISSSKDSATSKQTVEISTEYFRCSLNPYTLVKLLQIAARISLLLDHLKSDIGKDAPAIAKASTKAAEGNATNDTTNAVDKKEVDFDSNKPFGNFSVHILCYNFCLGWVYNDYETERQEIVLGCERVYIITEETAGKLTIVDGYCSTISGNSFETRPIRYNKKQRALLPNVQLVYSITSNAKGKRNLHVKMTGEVLDVRLVSEYVRGSDKFIKSIITTQKLKEELVPDIVPVKTSPVMEESGYMESLSSLFTSVDSAVAFAGAYVKIEKSSSKNAALELHSPAMEITFGYKKVIGVIEHLIRCEVTTFASDNFLDSNCVPVLTDLLNGFNMLMKEESLKHSGFKDTSETDAAAVKKTEENLSHRLKKDKPLEVKENDKMADSSSPIDFAALLKNIDFNGVLNIQPQSLSLSCAPAAKIKAIVATKGIKLQLSTVEDTEKLITGSLLFKEMTAQLQHVYSREVSGSFSVGKIMINGILQQQEKALKIFTMGEISKVSSYIKVNQLQDLNVFKDIWIPKNKPTPTGEEGSFIPFQHPKLPNIIVDPYQSEQTKTSSKKPRSRTFAERVHEVSTTNAYPWNTNFVVSDVSLVVDLGRSLGIASLLLDKIWLVQTKNSEWEQNLTMGVDALVLKCEGRLASEIALRKLRMNSVIKWANMGVFYEIPLVFLSGGIDVFEIIVGFDYHTFFVSNVDHVYLSLFNQRDQDEAQLDRLFGTASLERINVYSTCLAASSFMDIINAFLRIREDNKSSYKEVLRDAGSLGLKPEKNSKRDWSILEKFTNLKTEVGVTVEKFLLQVYPSSLVDTDVLVVNSGRVSAKYIRRLAENELSSSLSLHWNNLDVALSKLKVAFKDKVISTANIDRYVKHTLKASGGAIFLLPLVSIAMETTQFMGSKEIRYKFDSSFGGTVDIRWNLGSVSFIKAMYVSHERALSARLAKNKAFNMESDTNEAMHKTEETLESLRIKQKFEKAEHDSEYVYVAVEPPHIEPPRLKELGDVTPPLEWFGLHRKNFPAVTHHFIILPLEHFVINVEKQYNSVLGKA